MSMTGVAAPPSPGIMATQLLPPNNNTTGNPLPDLPATSFSGTSESGSSGAGAGAGGAAASTGGVATSAPGKRKSLS